MVGNAAPDRTAADDDDFGVPEISHVTLLLNTGGSARPRIARLHAAVERPWTG
jgi:hypothetical protein